MRKRINDETILQAALKCFAAYGYKKTTLEDIAGELGLGNSSVYAYTESKRALYEDTVRYVMLRWQGRVKAAVEEQLTAAGRFRALCETALLYLSEDAAFCALLRSDPTIFPMFAEADPYEEINADSVAMIARILDEGQASGEFRRLDTAAVSDVLFSLYKGFIIRAYVEHEDRFMEGHLTQTLDLILNGIQDK
ncbi:MAG: TetR/AcrR family transcriptional regulator [Bacillota bacterium]